MMTITNTPELKEFFKRGGFGVLCDQGSFEVDERRYAEIVRHVQAQKPAYSDAQVNARAAYRIIARQHQEGTEAPHSPGGAVEHTIRHQATQVHGLHQAARAILKKIEDEGGRMAAEREKEMEIRAADSVDIQKAIADSVESVRAELGTLRIDDELAQIVKRGDSIISAVESNTKAVESQTKEMMLQAEKIRGADVVERAEDRKNLRRSFWFNLAVHAVGYLTITGLLIYEIARR